MWLFNEEKCIDIVLKNKSKYVELAVIDMKNDFKRISEFSVEPKILNEETDWCIVIEENTSSENEPIKDEAFKITTEGNKIVISASGYLGTMWGIYTFSEKILGVSPCYIFDDFPVKKQDKLEISEINIIDGAKTFGFRGAFLNDEDLLSGWKSCGGIRHMDYKHYTTTVNSEVISKVVETVLRLRMNLVIPASFLDIDNPCEKALADEVAKRGIYVSQHHLEPCGVSAFTYENFSKKNNICSEFSYISNAENMEKAWRYYVEKWSEYPNVVWQLGLRGKADRPLWQDDIPTENELEFYASFISGAYNKQKEIILEKTNGKAKYFTTTLWMEGSSLMQKGYLKMPENTMVVFSDNGPDQMYGGDFYKIERNFSSGIYYHLQFFDTGPHLAPQTPIEKFVYNINLARNMGDTSYFIVNLSNVREFTYEINAMSKILWDFDGFSKEEYKENYSKLFGENGIYASELIEEYYNILPELPQELRFLHNGHLFNYSLELPENIKAFIAKEGIICKQGKLLVENFKRSYNDELTDGIYKVVKEAVAKYENLKVKFENLCNELDADAKLHLECKWLLYTDLILSLYKWFICIYEAKQAFDNNNADKCVSRINLGIEALGHHLVYRKVAEYGDFKNWYRGDRKDGLAKMLFETYEILGLTPELL